MEDNKRIKIEATIEENDYISYGFHSFFNKRGKSRNIIVGAFLFLLIIQSIRELLSDNHNYLYVFLLAILIIFLPINIYTSYKGYFKKYWFSDKNVIYTIDKEYVRIKKGKSNDKRSVSQLAKITEDRNAIYLWWKNDYDTCVIPKRFCTGEDVFFIKALSPLK